MPPGGGDPKKKKPNPADNYKRMVAQPDTAKLMVEKADGSIGEWGNDIPSPPPTLNPPKKKIPLSDKASGLSNTYYPANGQQTGPAIPTKK